MTGHTSINVTGNKLWAGGIVFFALLLGAIYGLSLYYSVQFSSPFAQTLPTNPVVKPWINNVVVTPDAYDKFLTGSVLPVRWFVDSKLGPTPTDLSPLNIILENYMTNEHTVMADNTPNDGIFDWTIPADFPIGKYRIYLVCNKSSTSHTCNSGTSPQFEIINLAYGCKYGSALSNRLAWSLAPKSAPLGGTADYNLLRTVDGVTRTIKLDLAKRTYIDSNVTSGKNYQYQIATGLGQILSNSVSINPTTGTCTSKLQLSSPNGGNIFNAGQFLTVGYYPNLLALPPKHHVKIDLLKPGGALVQNLTSDFPGTSVFFWKIPDTMTGQFKIRINMFDTATGTKIGTDTSDTAFTIIPKPTITMLAPVSGSNPTWYSGGTTRITWIAKNVSPTAEASLVCYRPMFGSEYLQRVATIGNNIPSASGDSANPNYFDWKIPYPRTGICPDSEGIFYIGVETSNLQAYDVNGPVLIKVAGTTTPTPPTPTPTTSPEICWGNPSCLVSSNLMFKGIVQTAIGNAITKNPVLFGGGGICQTSGWPYFTSTSAAYLDAVAVEARILGYSVFHDGVEAIYLTRNNVTEVYDIVAGSNCPWIGQQSTCQCSPPLTGLPDSTPAPTAKVCDGYTYFQSSIRTEKQYYLYPQGQMMSDQNTCATMTENALQAAGGITYLNTLHCNKYPTERPATVVPAYSYGGVQYNLGTAYNCQ